MTAEVVVDRLRTSLPDSAARSAVAALEPLARDYGRGILMVRSLHSSTADPRSLRDQVDDLRRRSARPASGHVDPQAQAVFFADEAELVMCLSEDLLHGRANRLWWWATRLSREVSPVDSLAALWIREPLWGPLVIDELYHRSPSRLLEVLRAFQPQQISAVIAGIAAAYLRSTPAASSPRGVEPSAATKVPGDLTPRVRALLIAAITIAASPGEACGEAFRSWLEEARATGVAAPSAAGVLAPPAATNDPPAPQTSSSPEASTESGNDDDLAEVIPLAPRLPHPAEPNDEEPPAWSRRPWEGSGTEVESEMATALYAVNLVERLHLEAVAGHQATGWAVVESIIRRLLRDVSPRRRSALLGDPLLPLLGELDTRPPGRPNPVRRGPWFRAVHTYLHAHDIDTTAFTRPGRIVVSRTHLDVVLGIDQIDLAIRASGLDQDPGWAPYFGRVILFHFEDTP